MIDVATIQSKFVPVRIQLLPCSWRILSIDAHPHRFANRTLQFCISFLRGYSPLIKQDFYETPFLPTMPHLFANRSRKLALLRDVDSPFAHMTWQWVSAFLYIVGGLFLVIGSVLFLPEYEDYADVGSYMFVVASVIYLWVSAHDIMEVLKAPREKGTNDFILDLTASFSYAIGAILFIIGSILFLPDAYHAIAAASCFIIGSVLFDVGACVNAVQIWSSPDIVSAQIANLVAINFIMGSTFYVAASVPYLFQFNSESDAKTEFAYVATLYIIGSVQFVIAGFLDMKRFHWVDQLSVHPTSQIELPVDKDKHQSKADVPQPTEQK
jgi:hypothetical protein